MYYAFDWDYVNRMKMLDRHLIRARIDFEDEAMAWLESHDCKESCQCLKGKGEPVYA